jgi:hypothetical protein
MQVLIIRREKIFPKRLVNNMGIFLKYQPSHMY